MNKMSLYDKVASKLPEYMKSDIGLMSYMKSMSIVLDKMSEDFLDSLDISDSSKEIIREQGVNEYGLLMARYNQGHVSKEFVENTIFKAYQIGYPYTDDEIMELEKSCNSI